MHNGAQITVVTFLTAQFILNIENANGNIILEGSGIIATILRCEPVLNHIL